MVDTEVHFKDFTKKRKPISFKLGDENYECVKALSVVAAQNFAAKMKSGGELDERNASTRLLDALQVILKLESFERFKIRWSDPNHDDPIDAEQLTGIVEWAMEVYGLRPTEPSSDSSSGLPTDDAGTSSTAGALHEEWTPSN